MKWEYEKACKKAGLNETEIQEIRKIFDSEKSRRKVNQKNREESGYREISVEAILENEEETFELPDALQNTEEDALKEIALSHLRDFLKRFNLEDQYILLSWGTLSDREAAKRLGMKKSTLQDRRKRLIKELQQCFKNETDLL
mgnify:CR=1 FL=1